MLKALEEIQKQMKALEEIQKQMKVLEEIQKQLSQWAKQVAQSPGAQHAPKAAKKLIFDLEMACDNWQRAIGFSLDVIDSKSVDGAAWRFAAIKIRDAAEKVFSLPLRAKQFCALSDPEDFVDRC